MIEKAIPILYKRTVSSRVCSKNPYVKLIKSAPEMFIFSINSLTIPFRADTLNVEYLITFNNPIWVNTLCT